MDTHIIVPLPKGLSKNQNPYCKEMNKVVNVDMFNDVFMYENIDDTEDIVQQDREPKYGLKKGLLLRLADAAGIIFGESFLIKNEVNNVIFQAKAFVRGYDGSYTEFSATTGLNITLELEKFQKHFTQLALQYQNSPVAEERNIFEGKSVGTWVNEKVKTQKLILKSNKIAIAETKAKLRLIRTILDLKSGYTQKELQQGFSVSYIEFKPDLKDEDTRKMYMMMGFNNPLYQQINKRKQPVQEELPLDENIIDKEG